MGRMFRIITEGNLDAVPAATAVGPAEGEPFVGGGAPFIEVGGPSAKPKPVEPVKAILPPRPALVAPVSDERYLSVALHGIAPKPVETPAGTVAADVVAFHHPQHAVSGEYRGLADDLRKQVGTDGPKAVLFTAAAADHGTTTVLLNLAVTLAKEPGQRVAVVDAEFDRPGAAQKFGLANVPGLADVLAQAVPLAWVLQPTAVPRLQLLPAGTPSATTAAGFAADFPKLVGQLRQWFDWVLVDGGVWGERPHRDAVTPAFDGVYLVTRESAIDRTGFVALRAQVAKQGGLLRGYITTRA